jgi:hypothetical protein
MSAARRTGARLMAQLAHTYTRKELAALFALVRAYDDAELLGAVEPTKSPPKSAQDTLLQDVRTILHPILARSAEKADLLIEHMTTAEGASPAHPIPKGIAHALRTLRKSFSDEEIRAGARGLIAKLARSHSSRETVV